MAMNMPMSMAGGASGMPLNQMQLQAPMGNLQQIAMPTAGQMPYPLQGSMIQLPPRAMQLQGMPAMPAMQAMQAMQPMQTMQQSQPSQMGMSQVSMPTVSQLPPGAITPLSSTTMMPVMGGIDGGGMNVVVPDLQPLSAMSGIGQQQAQMGRLSGGGSAGGNNWMGYGNTMYNNAGMLYNSQSMAQPQYPQQYQQQQYQQQQDQQQQEQQQQQQNMRMKSSYDQSGYREARNGLKWVIPDLQW